MNALTAPERLALERHREAIRNQWRADTYVCPRTAREAIGRDLHPDELSADELRSAARMDRVIAWISAAGLTVLVVGWLLGWWS